MEWNGTEYFEKGIYRDRHGQRGSYVKFCFVRGRRKTEEEKDGVKGTVSKMDRQIETGRRC